MSEKKQKVLIVHNYYQIPGGEDTVVANEKKLLEDHGHEVVLYTRHNSELNQMNRLQKLLLPISTVFNFQVYKEVKYLIKKEQVDVLHVHNTLNIVSPSVYYAGFACRVPVVQTVHNFRLLCPGATFFRDGHVCEECLEKGITCAVKHKCYRGSRVQTLACVISTLFHRAIGTYKRLHYICLTEFNKEKLLHLNQIKESQVFIKPNFVNSEKNILPYEQRKDQMIYVGRLEEIKGIDVLLDAWKLLGKDAPELLMCGKGPLEDWAKEFVKTNQLDKVKILGFVPNTEVRKMIGESKALVLPTKVYEGFPMTIAESYACGTPVIGSDLGNTGSLVVDRVSGFKFLPSSAEALAEAVRNLEEGFDGLGTDIVEKYSPENNYQRLREIYEACCNHH